MAKKRGKVGRPKAAETRNTIASFRGTDAFREWFEGFARAERETGASLIEKALVYYAKFREYPEEAPER